MIEQRAYVTRHTVTFEETNVVGNVYFSNYLRWQGHCRELFLREHAPAVLDELAAGLKLMTVRCSCEFYAELAAFDEIEVRMRLGRQEQNRIALDFDFVRLSPTESVVATGKQEIAFARAVGGETEAVSPPASLLAALRPYVF